MKYIRPSMLGRRSTLLVLSALVSLLLPAARAQQLGGVRGISVEVRIPTEAGEVRLYDESHALLIGASAYTNGWPSLPGVKLDISAVGEALQKHGFKVEVVMNPTSQNFNQLVRSFIARHGQSPGNRLLVYFAGHGHTLTTVDGRELGYIVPVDAPSPVKDVGGFKQTAVSMDEIEVYARQIESKHALFMFDSCFSGSLFESSRGVPPAIASRTAKPVRQFITAGTSDQTVPDRSVFREQFIEALGGEADANGDGYVTGSELGSFLEDRVTNYSNRAQTPRWGKIRNPALDKGDFVFLAGRVAAAPKNTSAATGNTGTALPPSLMQKIDPAAIELSYWETIKNSSNPEDFQDYMRQYPNGMFTPLARRRGLPAATATLPTNAAANNTNPDVARLRAPEQFGARNDVWHFEQGQALLGQGNFAEAEKAFRIAVSQAPHGSFYQQGLGDALGKQGKFAEAEKHHREAVRLNQKNRYHLVSLGAALEAQKKWADAARVYEEGTKLFPNTGFDFLLEKAKQR